MKHSSLISVNIETNMNTPTSPKPSFDLGVAIAQALNKKEHNKAPLNFPTQNSDKSKINYFVPGHTNYAAFKREYPQRTVDIELKHKLPNSKYYPEFINMSLRHGYCHIPNIAAGNTTLQVFLQNYEMDSETGREFMRSDIARGGSCFKFICNTNLNFYNLSTEIVERILSGTTSVALFSAVRNPFHKLYKNLFHGLIQNHHHIDHNMLLWHLNDFLGKGDDFHFIPQHTFINYPNINYDYLIRFETFDQDMKMIFPKYKMFSAVNSLTTYDKYQLVYENKEFTNKIIDYYQKDFDLFGYSIDPFNMEYDNNKIPRNIQKFYGNGVKDEFSIFRGKNLLDHGHPMPAYIDIDKLTQLLYHGQIKTKL